ncbi:hypothetical protein [Enemella sp. A6]|uniref:hypothetical protein n=1 Tax=Enemella sp. A6 TaxID=3440152 RepID=UPI003EBCBD2F
MKQLWTILRRWVNLAVIDAVRSGVPQPRQWSHGLRAVTAVGALAFLLAAALTLLSTPLRAETELAVGAQHLVLPSWSAPLVLWILVVAMSLAATAILHLHPVLRLFGWLALTFLMVTFLPPLANEPVVAFGLLAAGSLSLLVLIVVRWRKSFHPVEFLFASIAVSLGTLAPLVRATGSSTYGFDHRPLYIEGTLISFVLFAMPLLLVTGYAMAQVTTRLATDLGPSLDGRALAVVAAVLAVPALALIGWHWWQGNELWTFDAMLTSAVLLIVLVVLALPLWVRARGAGLPPVAEVDEGFGPWLYPIALGLVAQNLPVFMLTQIAPVAGILFGPDMANKLIELPSFTQTPMARAIWRILLSIGFVVAAWLFARRGRMGGPLAAIAAAAVIATGAVGTATGWRYTFTGEALIQIAVLVGGVTFIVRAVRRKIDQRTLIGLVGLLALTVAYPFRHLVGEPIDGIAGQAGGALVIFGVTWQLLSGAGFTRRSSRVAPAPARVLLFTANIVLTAAVMAWVALTRRTASVIDPAAYANTGDHMFGTPLLAAVLVLLVLQIITGGDARRVETREDEALEVEVAVHQQTGQVWTPQPSGPVPGIQPPWTAPGPPQR